MTTYTVNVIAPNLTAWNSISTTVRWDVVRCTLYKAFGAYLFPAPFEIHGAVWHNLSFVDCIYCSRVWRSRVMHASRRWRTGFSDTDVQQVFDKLHVTTLNDFIHFEATKPEENWE